MKKIGHVTLSDVARAAGLSTGGTSYALRAHPSIPVATVERVRRVAAELGYRPNLRVNSLMAMIRRGAPLKTRENLALVWINTPRRLEKLPIHLRHYARVILSGAQTRVAQLGCGLEQFWLNEGELRPARLNQILAARGISGVVFSPAGSDQAVNIDLEMRSLAGAIIGNTDCTPMLHRSAHYHYRSVWRTLDKLRDEGYSRPAGILSESVQNRIHSMQHAALLTNHPDAARAASFVHYGKPDRFPELKKWLRELKPDALILGWQIDERTARQLRALAPSVRRMVTLEWHPHGVLPGIDPCNDAIAANAVDQVVAQLHRNERGVPIEASTLLLDGKWRENPG